MISYVPSENENELQLNEATDDFHQLPLPSWLLSQHDLSILAANTKAEYIYNYNQLEWIGFSFRDLVITDDYSQLFNFLNQSSDSGQIFFLHTKDNKVLPGKLYVKERFLKGQKIWQVTAVNTASGNVSARQDLANNLEYKNVYMHQTSEGAWCYELEYPLPIDKSIPEMLRHFKEYAYLIDCNNFAAHMMGCKHPSELLGMRLSSVLDFEKQETVELLATFRQNNFKISSAEIEITGTGGSKYMACNFFAVIENSKLIRIWGTHLDVTEKKAIEKKVRLLACLLEESFDVLAATDLDWNHVTWNNGAEKIYGITAAQIIGKNIRSFIPEISYLGTTRDEVRAVLNKNGFWRGELSFIRPLDQKNIILLTHFKQLKDEKGIPVGYVFSATDITGKKESELQLKETENRFVEIANTAPVIIWMTDGDNKLNYINNSFENFTGISICNINSFEWTTLIHPDDQEKVCNNYEKCWKFTLPFTIVFRFLHKSGEYRWVLNKTVPRILDNGTFVGCISTISDIHAQKLRENQLRYQAAMLNNISDVIITTDLKHHVLSLNNVAEEVFGVSSESIKGKYLYSELVFDFGKPKEEVAAEFIANGIWKGEVCITGKNCNKKYFLFTTSYFVDSNGNRTAIMGVGRDITERKKADEKLQASEQFYRSLIAESANGILITEANGTLKYASNAVQSILGYDTKEVLGASCFQFIHPEDQQVAIEAFQRELDKAALLKSIVIRLRKTNGGWLWCLVRAQNQLNNPYVQGLVIHFHDDSMRKKASGALLESEHRFRSLIRDLQVGVVLLDADAKVLLSNKAINEIFAFGDENIIGKSLYSFTEDIIDEKGGQFTMDDCPLYLAVKNKTQVNDVVMGVFRPRTRDRVWVMMNADPILDSDGEIVQVICSIKDISERKKLEEKLLDEKINHQKQLTQATIEGQERERREIGKELHDNFGQQLTTIKLFLDMAKSTADDATNEMISMALKGVSDVINEMRRMSRNLMPPTLGDLGLIDSVFDLIEGINRTQAINIEFDFFEFQETYVSENKQLMAFRIIQEQLNNIIKHAQAENVTVKLYNNETETFLEIIDYGKGFDIKKVKRGLGLTNIRNRAEIFGGTATIDSSPGNGCQVRVCIPNKNVQDN